MNIWNNNILAKSMIIFDFYKEKSREIDKQLISDASILF